MTSDWRRTAQEQLLRLRTLGAGWGYRPDSPSYVEPTGLACLALLASEASRIDSRIRKATQESAAWMADIQNTDGSLGISESEPTPGWPTPYAMLLWSYLGTHAESLARATEWLLGRQGHAFKKPPGSPIGHDTTIPGWPWVENTHAWLEPTALAVLGLWQVGQSQHDRTRQGRRLIRDRAVRTGGWNYGNNTVFGRDLRPRPAPTGMALAALAVEGRRDDCVQRGLEYLVGFLPQTRSPQSLGWGLVGLRAWGVQLIDGDAWLAEAFDRAASRRDAASQLAYLLLADGQDVLEVLGIRARG